MCKVNRYKTFIKNTLTVLFVFISFNMSIYSQCDFNYNSVLKPANFNYVNTFSVILVNTQYASHGTYTINGLSFNINESTTTNPYNINNYSISNTDIGDLDHIVYLGDAAWNIGSSEIKINYSYNITKNPENLQASKSNISISLKYNADNYKMEIESNYATILDNEIRPDKEIVVGNLMSGEVITFSGLFELYIIWRYPQPKFNKLEVLKYNADDESSDDNVASNDSLYGVKFCAGDRVKFSIAKPTQADASFSTIVERKLNNGAYGEFIKLANNETTFIDNLSGLTSGNNNIFYRLKLEKYCLGYPSTWSLFMSNPSCMAYPSAVPDLSSPGLNMPYMYLNVDGQARTSFTMNIQSGVCEGDLPTVTLNNFLNGSTVQVQKTSGGSKENFTQSNVSAPFNLSDAVNSDSHISFDLNESFNVRVWKVTGDEIKCTSIKSLIISSPPPFTIKSEPDLSSGCPGFPMCGLDDIGKMTVSVRSGGNIIGDTNDSLYIFRHDKDNQYIFFRKLGNVMNTGIIIDSIPADTFKLSMADHAGCTSDALTQIMSTFFLSLGKEFGVKTSKKIKGRQFDLACHGNTDAELFVIYETAYPSSNYKTTLKNEQGIILLSHNTIMDSKEAVQFNNLTTGRYQLEIYDIGGTKTLYKGYQYIIEPPVLKANWYIEKTNGYDISCSDSLLGELHVDAPGYLHSLFEYGSKGKFTLYDSINQEINSFVPGNYPSYSDTIFNFFNSFNNISSGTYTIKIEDNNGCIDDTSVIIASSPNEIKISSYDLSDFNGYQISCFNAKNATISNIQVDGGYGNITLFLDNDTVFNNEKTNLLPGTYPLYAKDENLCSSKIDSIIITQPEPLLSTVEYSYSHDYNMRCFKQKDSALIIFQGGIAPYHITGDSIDIQTNKKYVYYSFSDEFNYSIQIQDVNHCQTNIDVNIDMPDTSVYFQNFYISEPSCYLYEDAVFSVQPAGGVSDYFNRYTLELFQDYNKIDSVYNSNANFNGIIPAGKYTIVITDENNCAVDTTIVVNQPQQLTAQAISVNNDCNALAPALKSEVEGGTEPYYYKWYNNQKDLVSLDAVYQTSNFDQYFLSVSDKNGCFTKNQPYSDTLIHTGTSTFLLNYIKNDATCFACSDGFVSLNAIGSYGTYLYSDNQSTWLSNFVFSNLSSGTYTFYSKDIGGCIVSMDIDIDEPGEFNAKIVSKTNIPCFGENNGQVTLEAVGGTEPFKYSKNNGVNWQDSPDFTALSQGNHTFMIEDKYGYQVNTSTIITQPDALSITLESIEHTLCNETNGAAKVKVEGGVLPYSLVWDDTLGHIGEQIDNLIFGKYTVMVTDNNSCKDSFVVYINNTDGPKIINKVTEPTLCRYSSDGKAHFSISSGTPPYQIVWDGNTALNDTFANYISNGSHEIMINDSLGCGVYDTINITSPDPIKIIKSVNIPSCYMGCDGDISVLPLGGTEPYNIMWPNVNGNPSSLQLYNLCAGDFILQISDMHSCFIFDTITLQNPQSLNVDAGDDIIICDGQIATLESPEGTSYLWENNGKEVSINRSYETDKTGKYILSVWNNMNCKANDTVEIKATEDVLKADFLLSAEAKVHDTIVVIEYSSPVPDSVKWKIPDVFYTVLDSSPLYWLQAQTPGEQTISLTVYYNNCSDSKDKVINIIGDMKKGNFIPTDTITDDPIAYQLSLFPNPAREYVTYSISKNEDESALLKVFNIYGKLIFRRNIERNEKSDGIIRLNNINPGIYFVEVEISGGRITKKLILY